MTPVPDQVQFRLDWPRFFATLSGRDRRLAAFLALGHSGRQAAGRFGLSPGRVTQLRQRPAANLTPPPVPAGPSRRGAGRRAGCFAVWSFLCGVFLFSYQRTGRHSAGGTARTLRCLTCPRTLAVHPQVPICGRWKGRSAPARLDRRGHRIGTHRAEIATGALAAAELAVPVRFWP